MSDLPDFFLEGLEASGSRSRRRVPGPEIAYFKRPWIGYTVNMKTTDPVLTTFRAALADLYGDRLERAVLYGSRARGDAQADSDYDIAIFLKELTDSWKEVQKIVSIQLSIREQTGADIHTLPFPAGYWQARTPLMHEIRQDGLDI
jgi:uncharacterized protein